MPLLIRGDTTLLHEERCLMDMITAMPVLKDVVVVDGYMYAIASLVENVLCTNEFDICILKMCLT